MALKSASPAALQILEEAGISELPEGWTVVRVEELLSDDRGISVGVMYPGDHDPQGIPLIKAGDLTGSRINPAPEFRVTREKHYEYRRTELAGGELLISLVGNVGRCAVVPPGMKGWNAARAVAVLRFATEDDAQFVRACLTSSPLQHLMQAWSTTTVQATLNLKEIRQLPLPWPPRGDRRSIAHILGTLDDKIELNRRMNETLEAMARALFQSWFVDFDPVHRNLQCAQGHTPPNPASAAFDQGSLEALAKWDNLFPDTFEDSPLGMIPRGWIAGALGAISSHRSERVGTREVTVLSAVSGGKLIRSDEHFTKQVYSKDVTKYLLVEQWDFAFNPSRINIGSIGMLEERILGGVSPVYVVVRPSPSYRWFLEFSLRQDKTKKWINTFASGSVRQSLSHYDFASIPCVVPPASLVDEFDVQWLSLRESLHSRQVESRTLTALRDTLLPKLISGELLVKDAERFVEGAV